MIDKDVLFYLSMAAIVALIFIAAGVSIYRFAPDYKEKCVDGKMYQQERPGELWKEIWQGRSCKTDAEMRGE